MSVAHLFPILRTRDLPRSVAFYERAFAATVSYRFADGGADVYVSLTIGSGQIGIGADPETSPGDAVSIWMYVDDVDAAYARAIAEGATSVAEPADMPWEERVAQVRDPGGTLLHLGAAD